MFIWPLDDYIITRGFAYLSSIYVRGMHAANDLIPRGRPAMGEPIRAVADGTVAGVGWDFYSGYFVAVDHAEGWRTFYRHLYGQTPVSVGQRVNQGQIIGNVGNTGYSLGAHLHFDLWNREKKDSTAFYKNGWWAHDPELYLGQEDDDMAFTPGQEAEIRRIARNEVIDEKEFEAGRNASNPPFLSAAHTLRVFMAILIELKLLVEEHIEKHGVGGGISAAKARAIAREEDAKQKITKSG